MPLTNLELTVDQRQPGWLDRAYAEATQRLRADARLAICADLRRSFGQNPSLEALARYVRLRVRAGEAAPHYTLASAVGTSGGRPDGSRSDDGLVPRRPHVQELTHLPEAEKNLWMLVAGNSLLVGSYLDEGEHLPSTSNVRRMVLGENRLWRPAWDLSGQGCWKAAASDGVHLAMVSVDAPNYISIRTLEIEGGRMLWSRSIPLKARSVQVVVSSALVVVLDGDNDNLTAYEAATGEMAWSQELPAAEHFLVFNTMRAIGAQIVLCGPQRLRVVEAASGQSAWERPVELWDGHRLWSGGGQLGLYDAKDTLRRFDLESGRELPEAPKLCASHKGASRIREGCLATSGQTVVINVRGELSAYRLDGNNDALWSVGLEGALHQKPLTIIGETVLLLTDGSLHGFSLRDGRKMDYHLEFGFKPDVVWGHPCGILVTGEGEATFVSEGQGA